MVDNKNIEVETFIDEGLVVLQISKGKIVSQSDNVINDLAVSSSVYLFIGDLIYWVVVGSMFLEKTKGKRMVPNEVCHRNFV